MTKRITFWVDEIVRKQYILSEEHTNKILNESKNGSSWRDTVNYMLDTQQLNNDEECIFETPVTNFGKIKLLTPKEADEEDYDVYEDN